MDLQGAAWEAESRAPWVQPRLAAAAAVAVGGSLEGRLAGAVALRQQLLQTQLRPPVAGVQQAWGQAALQAALLLQVQPAPGRAAAAAAAVETHHSPKGPWVSLAAAVVGDCHASP